MIERLQRMIARGSADFHSGSLTAYKIQDSGGGAHKTHRPQGGNTVRSSEYSYFSHKICPQERSKRPRAGKHVKQGQKSQRRPGLV